MEKKTRDNCDAKVVGVIACPNPPQGTEESTSPNLPAYAKIDSFTKETGKMMVIVGAFTAPRVPNTRTFVFKSVKVMCLWSQRLAASH